MKKRTSWRRRFRWLQRLTGIHSIHDIRYSYGYKLPFLDWAFFPAFTVKNHSFEPPKLEVRRYGWQRVKPSTYHDCTKTGRY